MHSFLQLFSIYLRSTLFLFGQVLSTFLIAPIMMAMRSFEYHYRYTVARIWVRFNLWWLKVICGLTYEVHGRENIPTHRSGLILCKHQSAFETIALQTIFPQMVFVLKEELLRIPFWGWAMATLEPIAIDRKAKSQALKQILRDGQARIQSGRWVTLFPEGTRVAPGEKARYGSSGGLLAHRAGCPVIPVAHNAGRYWAKNGFLKFPGTIQIYVGPPLEGAELSAAEINKRAEIWIETQMSHLDTVVSNGNAQP